MHLLRLAETQLLVKSPFNQLSMWLHSAQYRAVLILLTQQHDRGPVVEVFHMSRGCLLIRCGLQEIMREPVIAADGHTYEKAALESWLQLHNTSPVTGQSLAHLRIVPNVLVQIAIDSNLGI